MAIDQDKLAAILADARAKAEAALSPDDRWHLADDGSVWVDHGGQGSSASCLVETFPIWAEGMPAHIARMDPETTLLLLDAVETLQAEVANADKPAPCDMKHGEPFDFAWCETHDTTFPLGGACEWDGVDSILGHLDDKQREQRGRALRAEIRAEAAEAALSFTKGNLADVARDCEAAEAEAADLRTRLDEVRALHHPDQSGEFCDHCWTGPDAHGNGASPWWPCATIRALDGPRDGKARQAQP